VGVRGFEVLMALSAIWNAIQVPMIHWTELAHKSRLHLLQEQENMTSAAKLTLMGESVATGSIWRSSEPKRLPRMRMGLEGLDRA